MMMRSYIHAMQVPSEVQLCCCGSIVMMKEIETVSKRHRHKGGHSIRLSRLSGFSPSATVFRYL